MDFKFKKHLQNLERARVGTHINPKSSLFLNRNERVVPFDASILERLYQRLSKLQLNLYPDLELFYQKLTRWLGVSEKQIFVTEGVSGAIKSLIETIAEPGNNIIFPTPTFALYPVYCRMHNLEYRTIGYTKDYKLDIEALLQSIDEKTSFVFLPNPNVPIEGTLDIEQLVEIAKYCAKKKTYLAIDEVYYLYGGPTAFDLISDFDNVFVMRSFSKAFGLAGVRVGYLLGSADNIEYVSKIRTGYETSSVSAEIVSFFIDNYYLIEEYLREVREGLDYLKSEFRKLGLEYDGGNSSNFIFVDLGKKVFVEQIIQRLNNKNIFIRGGWPEPYSSGISVTAGPKPVMQKFMQEFLIAFNALRRKNGR